MIPEEAVKSALTSWFDGMPYGTNPFEAGMRAALESAAPFIRAQALEDAAAYIEGWIKAGADDPISPDATRNWLRARAVTERGGE